MNMIKTLSIGSVVLLAGLAPLVRGEDWAAAAARYLTEFNRAHPHTVRWVAHPDGVRVNVREFGSEHRDKGASIVLLHGFPDSQHLYDPVAVKLATAHHVVTFDFVGWGDSDKPVKHRYDVESLKRDLDLVVETLRLNRVILVLHDLSGQPGIDWASQNPQKVERLVLLNTYYSPMKSLVPPEEIARFSSSGVWRALSVWGASRFDGMWQRGVHAQLAKFFSSDEARATYLPLFVHQALGIRPAFFGENRVLRKEIADRAPKAGALRNFMRPVRIVFGADDPYLNQGVAREFAGLFPNATSIPVSGGAHYVQLDQPAKVAALIVAP